MQRGNDVMEQVLNAESHLIQVDLRLGRQVRTSLRAVSFDAEPSSRSHTGEKLDKPFPKLSARSRQTVPREKASFDALSPDQTTGYTRKHGPCSQLAFRRATSFRSPSKASTRRKAGRRSGRIRHRLDCLGGTELETALPVAMAADLAGVFGSVCEPSGLGLTLALPAG